MAPGPFEFSKVIDHTFLLTEKEGVSEKDQIKQIEKLCLEAHQYHAYSVCVRENRIAQAKKYLNELDSSVLVCSVLGFPDGDALRTTEKLELLVKALEDGAQEVDIVLRVQDLQEQNLQAVYNDVLELSLACLKKSPQLVLKVIFEMARLTLTEKRSACKLTHEAFQESFHKTQSQAVRFWKTSTGFYPLGAPQGALLKDVELLAQSMDHFKTPYGIKPAGGISNLSQAQEFWQACHSPQIKNTHQIDPMRFRIGSSSLLLKLNSQKTEAFSPSY